MVDGWPISIKSDGTGKGTVVKDPKGNIIPGIMRMDMVVTPDTDWKAFLTFHMTNIEGQAFASIMDEHLMELAHAKGFRLVQAEEFENWSQISVELKILHGLMKLLGVDEPTWAGMLMKVQRHLTDVDKAVSEHNSDTVHEIDIPVFHEQDPPPPDDEHPMARPDSEPLLHPEPRIRKEDLKPARTPMVTKKNLDEMVIESGLDKKGPMEHLELVMNEKHPVFTKKKVKPLKGLRSAPPEPEGTEPAPTPQPSPVQHAEGTGPVCECGGHQSRHMGLDADVEHPNNRGGCVDCGHCQKFTMEQAVPGGSG